MHELAGDQNYLHTRGYANQLEAAGLMGPVSIAQVSRQDVRAGPVTYR